MAVNCRERGARYATAFVLCLVLVSTVAAPIITATAAPQHQRHEQKQTHVQKQSQRHTLVIIHVSGSPSWSITASGSIQLDTNTTENTDSIGGKTADGSVGGLPWENTSDPRDVIYYTGEVLQFDLGGTGDARVILDGERVNPQSLKNTPTPTPTQTPSPTAPAPTVSSTGEPTTPPVSDQSPTVRSPSLSPTASPSPTSPPSPSSPSSPSSSGVIEGEFVLGLAGGLLLILVCGALLALLQ
jgi:hypothetical protein